MPDLTRQGFYTKDPTVYDYTLIGTAAGTTTIMSNPGFLHSVFIPTRVASATLTLYDSIGTSTAVIGTITLGTQTFSDPPLPYEFDCRLKTALTIVNSGNLGAIVLFKS